MKARTGGGGEVARLAIADAMPLARDVYVRAVFESDDVECEPLEAISFLAEPRDPRMPPPILRAAVDEGPAGPARTLLAESFAPWVWWRLEGSHCRQRLAGASRTSCTCAREERAPCGSDWPAIRRPARSSAPCACNRCNGRDGPPVGDPRGPIVADRASARSALAPHAAALARYGGVRDAHKPRAVFRPLEARAGSRGPDAPF